MTGPEIGAPYGPGAVRRLTLDEQVRLASDIQRRIGVRVRRDERLSRHTTMRVGGPADLYVEVHTLFELRGLVRFLRGRGVPVLLLGRGSDLVIGDAGVAGIVVEVRAQQYRVDGSRIIADAGVPMARVATVAKEAGLSGAEFALAIPGTLGGAVWANAGAHGSEIRSVLQHASVISAATGNEQALGPDELGLGYRTSNLKRDAGGFPDVVTWAALELVPTDTADVTAKLAEIRRWRQDHQPIGLASAGSVFRNPPEGRSAGALIDGAGLKGLRIGGATVSEKHANFIVNDRGATASDVRHLATLVRRRVEEATGVVLEYEVVFAGDWTGWQEDSIA
jgi:UDP-N-acetylmuramate dehydrogenase